jgi:nucleoside diphosphate kinase
MSLRGLETTFVILQIEAHGIEILKNEERHLTEDEVKQFYSHLQEESFFDELVKFMTSGNSHVLVLTKGRTGDNIISDFRDLIGPTTVEEAKEAQPER